MDDKTDELVWKDGPVWQAAYAGFDFQIGKTPDKYGSYDFCINVPSRDPASSGWPIARKQDSIELAKSYCEFFASAIRAACEEAREKARAEMRQYLRAQCEEIFENTTTAELEDLCGVRSDPTLWMLEILRRNGTQMVDGEIVPLPDNELRALADTSSLNQKSEIRPAGGN